MKSQAPRTYGAVVDFHTHAFPDHVAARATQALVSAYNAPLAADGTINGLLASMDQAGVARSVVLPVATRPEQVVGINDWAVSLNGPRLVMFGAMHHEFPDPSGEISRIADLGIKGIKIHGNWQDIYVDDPRLYPTYAAASGRLTVVFHSGAELGPIDEIKADPRRIASVRDRFPNLTMVVAHMGGYLMWDEAADHLAGSRVYLDTSACYPRLLPDERFVDMIRAHGVDRVLFGTDSPINRPQSDIDRLSSCGLSDDELERILCTNAAKLLGD